MLLSVSVQTVSPTIYSFHKSVMSYVKILQLIIIYTAFKCVDLLFFLLVISRIS